jgi:hypothetical protein
LNLIAGITLIEIGYWWDGTKDSLAATIHSHRPDIISLPPFAKPIPTSPPETGYFIQIELHVPKARFFDLETHIFSFCPLYWY